MVEIGNIKPHLFYNKEQIGIETIKRIRFLIKEQHFFKCNDDKKMRLLIILCNDLSEIYNIKKIGCMYMNKDLNVRGCFLNPGSTICLNKPSLVTFLHEFKHFLNCETKQHNNNINDEEMTAIGFSHSLYFLATPNLFKSAVEKNLLVFQDTL